MIYLFSGDDSVSKFRAFDRFSKSLPKNTETFSINRNDFNKMQIESLYSGSGLFFAKPVVVFSDIFDHEETRDFIFEKLDLISESATPFVFLEGKLNKTTLDLFRKAGAELNVFELPKIKVEKFDNFLIANAFAVKDKLNLWIYFRQAMERGVGMEEIIGVLFWKIKDALIRRNYSKFTEDQLKDFASRLSYLLPKARKESRDAEAAFEQFLLEAF